MLRLHPPLQSDTSMGEPALLMLGRQFRLLATITQSFGSKGFIQHINSKFPRNVRTCAMIAESELNSTSSISHKVSNHNPIKLDDEVLRRAIAYEAQRDFSNSVGRTTRFSDFLSAKLFALLTLHTSSKGESALQDLAVQSRAYDQMSNHERRCLLDKVSGILGFHGVQDLIDHHTALTEASQDLHLKRDKPKALALSTPEEIHTGDYSKEKATKRQSVTSRPFQQIVHPSIVIGSSERIDLSTVTCEGENVNSSTVQIDATPSPKIRTSEETSSSKFQSVELTGLCNNGSNDAEKSVVQAKKASRKLGIASSRLHKVDFVNSLTDKKIKEKMVGKSCNVSSIYDSWLLNKPISLAKGLSPRQRARLDENGIHTLRKLLHHFPRTYLNFQSAGQIVEDGQYLTFFGKIISSKGFRKGSSLGILEVVVKSAVDPDGGVEGSDSLEETSKLERRHVVFLHLKRFFRGARFSSQWFLNKMIANYPVGEDAAVSGKVKAMEMENHFELREFNLELSDTTSEMDSEVTKKEKPYPVYPTKAALDAKSIEFCIQKVLSDLPYDIDPLPESARIKFELMELREAYFGIHTPTNLEVAEKARQRFVFEEFFYLQLGLLLQRHELTGKYLEVAGMAGSAAKQESGTLEMEKWSPLTLRLLRSLPYRLTNSQIKATSEIMWDLQRPVPMSRLLQGDVGCGKTIVAFLSLLEVIDAGYQGAIMAPTEFLANQHYQRIISWLEHLEEKDRPRVALLTGSVPLSKSRSIRKGLETGEITLAVGTHSLIADSLKFAALGLAVIDEQHRFGVAQRVRLNNKGVVMNLGVPIENFERNTDSKLNDDDQVQSRMPNMRAPHVLAMSATPIPRTLALAVHGDMGLSQITELPPGRVPIKTYVLLGNTTGLKKAFEMGRNEVKNGGRIFLVFPVIEESTEMPNLKACTVEFDTVTKEFEGYNCGLVHGKMKTNEKEEAMRHFQLGETHVLVSTTVIEVGIDIPEASMIIVINAERYGLAQLHQLRGRVGRGNRESVCVLLSSSATSLERLKILEESRDGFYLAEVDLRFRGPGDLLGKQQSGHLPEFTIARLEEDAEVMNSARIAAEEILCEYPDLEGLPRLKQELSFRRPPNSLGA